MADQKISAMPTASAFTGAELLPVVQSSDNVKTTISDLADYVATTYSQAFADKITTVIGQSAYTLTANPGSINNMIVALDGATLVPGGDYTWDGSVTLTLTQAPVAVQDLVVFYSGAVVIPQVAAGSVTDLAVATGQNPRSMTSSWRRRRFRSKKTPRFFRPGRDASGEDVRWT